MKSQHCEGCDGVVPEWSWNSLGQPYVSGTHKCEGCGLSFDQYAAEAEKTALTSSMQLGYCLMGLAGEVGEVMNTYKKLFRDSCDNPMHLFKGKLNPEAKAALLDELGDVLWYLCRAAEMLGSTLEWTAEMNVRKLAKRAKELKIQGSGNGR